MFGGERLKRTCIASNNPAILQLNVLCDGQHVHKPWTYQQGQFDTAKEAEYTAQFAKALANTVFASLVPDNQLDQFALSSKRLKRSQFAAIGSQIQPQKSLPELVPEFAYLLVLRGLPLEIPLPVDSKSSLTRCVQLSGDNAAPVCIPCGSKQLRLTIKKGEYRQFSWEFVQMHSLHESLKEFSGCSKGSVRGSITRACSCDDSEWKISAGQENNETTERVFGIRWTPKDFMNEASHLRHPFDSVTGVDPFVKEACSTLAKEDPGNLIISRCKMLGKWIAVAKELSERDRAIKEAMSPERKRIMSSKKLALTQWIIDQTGYEDVDLAKDMAHGFSLVGDVPKSGRLPDKVVPARMAVEDLHSQASKSAKAIRYMTRSSGELLVDAQLWEKTLSEVDSGWLAGPLDWGTLGPHDTVSRRFGLVQANKLRPIDDYSQSQVNATVTTYEKPTVDNPDVVCALAMTLILALQAAGKSTRILARSLDLTSAYRQLCISDDSAKYAFLSVFDPTLGSAALFRQIALPFGSKTSVNAFIRCSRFLQWVAARCFSIPMSCYYDDFVIFTTPALEENTQQVIALMFDLLGWAFDKTGAKADVFSQTVSALGVVFNLESSQTGLIAISNTERRLNEAMELLKGVLHTRKLGHKQALVLRGRLAFCDAFIFGRTGKLALQIIMSHAYMNPFVEDVNDYLYGALTALLRRFQNATPRMISTSLYSTFHIYTDAAFSDDFSGGLGGVLCDAAGRVIQWFGLQISAETVKQFVDDQQQVAIGELETLAVLLAVKLWNMKITSAKTIFFIDNEGAKFSLIKGYSSSKNISHLCSLITSALDAAMILPWFSRVPSPSNIADIPSRNLKDPMLTECSETDRKHVEVALKECLEDFTKFTFLHN